VTPTSLDWDAARAAAFVAVRPLPELVVPLLEADGLTLARPLIAPLDLPAFRTSTVDGYAVAGPGPWLITGEVLAGTDAGSLLIRPGTAIAVATGAMVPAGAQAILRIEDATEQTGPPGRVLTGTPRRPVEWREPGDEARTDDELLPAGWLIGPGVVGMAATCGLDTLHVRPRPRVAVRVFGDELLTAGPPTAGKVRDSLGPSLPGWVRRLGADPLPPPGPVQDTRDAHVSAIGDAAVGADLVLTTGGTMHGPVDHLHAALESLGATLVVDTVQVRPGFPMLLATLPDGTALVGLPGNPLSAVVALLTLAAPALAGLRGGALAGPVPMRLAGEIRPRPGYTHLAPVRTTADGSVLPVGHTGSSMLRGLASSNGLAVLRAGAAAAAGRTVPVLPLPLLAGELA
jgi:molybdopterin molybdotransferase